MKHVPPAKAQPVPEPPNTQDKAIVEGPHRHKIAALLDELTEIVMIDWQYRHLIPRRNAIFVELRKLNVTLGRMRRAYAVAPLDENGNPSKPTPLITHVGINNALDRAGFPIERKPAKEEETV